jgi:hypothetical protein
MRSSIVRLGRQVETFGSFGVLDNGDKNMVKANLPAGHERMASVRRKKANGNKEMEWTCMYCRT